MGTHAPVGRGHKRRGSGNAKALVTANSGVSPSRGTSRPAPRRPGVRGDAAQTARSITQEMLPTLSAPQVDTGRHTADLRLPTALPFQRGTKIQSPTGLLMPCHCSLENKPFDVNVETIENWLLVQERSCRVFKITKPHFPHSQSQCSSYISAHERLMAKQRQNCAEGTVSQEAAHSLKKG